MDARVGQMIGEHVKRATECAYETAFPDCTLIKKLNEFMQAKKAVSVVSGRTADSGTVDFVDVDDYRIQLDALKLVCDLRGLLKKKMELSGPGGAPITFDSVDPKERALLERASREIQKAMEGKRIAKKRRKTKA